MTRCAKALYVAIGTGLLLLVVGVFLSQTSEHAIKPQAVRTKPPKAAIVDQLSLSFPSPSFVRRCTAVLEGAGFAVDYYPGKEVTVKLYKNLPTHNYDLIILRAHSAYIEKHSILAIFTSEPYTKDRYVYEQLRHRIARGKLEQPPEGDPGCLAITDKFIRHSMKGSFKDSSIIMMGCAGIRAAAKAFLKKEARVYIGWDGRVSADHTDLATLKLLETLLIDGKTVRNAVAYTMKEVGVEPPNNSLLLFWPIRAGNYRIDGAKSKVEG